MHHEIDFNYFESGAKAFGFLDMTQFLKISVTKCSHSELTETISGFKVHMDQIRQASRQNMPYSFNKCQTG